MKTKSDIITNLENEGLLNYSLDERINAIFRYKLKPLLEEYLEYHSSDGSVIRPEMRNDLSILLGIIDDLQVEKDKDTNW
jgi:hypothetical protein